MERVLVTGGAGFIGSHTADALLRTGYEVRILDNLSEPVHRGGRAPDWLPTEAELVKGDVRVREDMERALQGVTIVYHLAAYQDYLTNFSEFFHTNTVGTSLLYELIVEKKLPIMKVVLASSQAVYGEGKYVCHRDGVVYPSQRELARLANGDWDVRCPHCGDVPEVALTDEGTVNPHNQYAISKYTQELIALHLGRRYSIPTVALRYSITVGPRQSFYNAYSGACRIFTMRVLAGEPPLMYEDGRQLRDYVHIDDVIKANLLVLKEESANYEVFNVGGGKAVTVEELAGLVIESVGESVQPARPGKFRVGDTRHIISDLKKLTEIGYRPEKLVKEAVEAYVNWARQRKEFYHAHREADKRMLEEGVVRSTCGQP